MIQLPQITEVRLFNYQPLLKENIKVHIPSGCFLVLGGNGLGKTTILQSIIYCIAGPLDVKLELEKRQRWDSSYFRGRVNPDLAYIEVDFIINNITVSIKRGFNNAMLLGVKIGDNGWITDSTKRQEYYEACIIEEGNYSNFEDFRYIIHKLVYLPEIRPNLAWDKDAQTRILMTLCSDIINEKVFRDKRKLLKETDSKKRHIHVQLEKARKELATIDEYEEDEEDIEISYYPQLDNIEVLVEKLKNASEIRRWHQKEISEIQKNLSEVTIEVEKVNEKVSQLSESYILESINEIESKEVALALHKLISMGLCPACGKKAPRLQIQARKFVIDSCPLCGDKHETISTAELSTLHVSLSDLMKKKHEIEREILNYSELKRQAETEEQELQTKYDQYRLTLPIAKLSTCEELPGKKEEFKFEFERLSNLHSEFEIRCIDITRELEEEYNRFQQNAGNRIQRLSELYQFYASAFLGKECSLVKIDSDDRLLDLSLFVPSFDNKERAYPAQCSEAQRFFLDIAFRMAIVHLASEQSSSAVSFICETPENALDMSYIDNVATMFRNFSTDGRSIILTANLQLGSVAKPILEAVDADKRHEHYINLLEYGNLSDVQINKLPQLMEVFNDIVG